MTNSRFIPPLAKFRIFRSGNYFFIHWLRVWRARRVLASEDPFHVNLESSRLIIGEQETGGRDTVIRVRQEIK